MERSKPETPDYQGNRSPGPLFLPNHPPQYFHNRKDFEEFEPDTGGRCFSGTPPLAGRYAMPIKILEKASFIYIAYSRKTPGDFLALRKDIVSCATVSKNKDIVLDLMNDDTIGDGEILLLTNIAREFSGSSRKIWVLAPQAVQQKLEKQDLFKTGNAVGFENRDELLKNLNDFLIASDK